VVVTMKNEEKAACVAGVLALGWLWWAYQSELPNVIVDPRSLPDNQYDPFTTWRSEHSTEWFRPFPATVGANCLPVFAQTADSGLALTQDEVYGGSCAQ
jgi:hypothetical protein